MNHPFSELSGEYASWVADVRPRPECIAAIDQVARRLIRPDNLAHYDEVFAQIKVPQVVQATICEREDGNDFTKSPAQGDPWNRVSVHVPRGRGPFTSWKASAIDAWTVCDQLNVLSVPEWTLPYACWKWEGYNGFGYRAHGIRTPYVLGGTNLQQPGKYIADGNYDPNHMDTQLGALPVAMRMIELTPRLAFGGAVAIAVVPAITVPVLPAPVGVGGSLTGTMWIQSSANLILHLDPPLLIDGSFGRKTRDAVRSLQAGFGLLQNGLVDDALCSAIDSRLATMKPVDLSGTV